MHGTLLLAGVVFSTNYIISKLGMNAFSPLTFAWLRVLGATLLMQLVLPPNPRPFTRSDLRQVSGFALFGVVINQTLFLAGLKLTNAHVAAILITLIPVFALAIAIVTGRERGTPWKIGGIALACIGALLVLSGEGLQGSTASLAGAVMLVLNCLSYSTYLVISKPAMSRLSPLHVVSRMFAISTVLMLPICAWSLAHENWGALPVRAWVALLLVIVIPTVLGYLLNGWALRHADSSLVAMYTYVQPVVATVLAAIFLKEEIRGIVAFAAVLIFSGVAVASRRTTPA